MGGKGLPQSKGSLCFRKDSLLLPCNEFKTPELLVGKDHLSQAPETAGLALAAVAGTCRAFSFTNFQFGAIKMPLCSLQLT